MSMLAHLLAAIGILAADVPPVAVPITGLGGSVISANGGSVWQGKAGGNSQAFLSIHNEGGGPDVLTGWSCGIADTTVLADADGKPMQALPIPANQSITLVAAGPHLVLRGTHFEISAGSVVPCTLIFKNALQVGVMLNGIPAPAQ